MDVEALAQRLAAWLDMCVVKWSPWLFRDGKTHSFTVVDKVAVRFEKDLPESHAERIWHMLRTMPGVTSCDDASRVLAFGASRYQPWEFRFTWEPLTMHIGTERSYFEDDQGRQSRCTFLHDPKWGWGAAWTVAHPGTPTIPWLLCQS